MPEIYEMPITVCTHETGPDGYAGPQAVLRWMQEVAIRASAANGFDDDFYHRTGTAWVLGGTCIDYPVPVRARDSITVQTWIADFQRITSRRQYLFTREDDVIARGSSEWVFVSTKRRRPTRITPEMSDGFPIRPVYAPLDPDWGKDLVGDPPETGAWDAGHTVRWSDLDVYGHVNNAMYAQWFCDALYANNTEPRMVRRLRINYAKDATFGDSVRGSIWRIDERHVGGILRNDTTDEVLARSVVEIGEPGSE
jgi:acyl-CoA thioesterase FadM